MRKTALILFFCFLVFPTTFLIAQDEEFPFKWKDDFYWEPDPAVLSGLREIGVLQTDNPELELKSPEAVQIVGDKLYLFDVELEKLLLFDTSGRFIKSLFAPDQKITNRIYFISALPDGRVLLGDFRDLYLFENGEITKYTNYQRVNSMLWDGEKAYTLKGVNRREENPLVYELSLEGEVLDSWGEDYDAETHTNIFFPRFSYTLADGILYCTDISFPGFVLINPASKVITPVSISKNVFTRRIEETKKAYAYSTEHKLNRFYNFRIFVDLVVHDGDVYLLMADPGLVSIVRCSPDGEVKNVYRTLDRNQRWYMKLAVAGAGESLSFFLKGAERDGEEYRSHVWMFAPGGEPGAVADAISIMKDVEAEKSKTKAGKEAAKQQKEWDAWGAASDAIRKSEDPAEKRRLALEFIAKNPDALNAGYLVLSVFRKDLTPEAAAEALPQIRVALSKAKNEHAVGAYYQTLSFLNIAMNDVKALKGTLDGLLEKSLNLRNIYALFEPVEKFAAWEQLLRLAEAMIPLTAPEQMLKSMGGMSEEQATEYGARYKSMALEKKALALTRLGRHDEALVTCKEAAGITPVGYTGTSLTKYRLCWAETLEAKGDFDAAIDVLIHDALFGGGKEMMVALERIYAAAGRAEPFADFVKRERLARAKKLDNATFYDYGGKAVSVNEKLGKATLLTFWTPST